MWQIIQVLSTPEMILNYRDQLDQVSTVTKTRQDYDVTDYTGVVYTKNDIELSWSIRSSVNCDKN